METLKLPVSNFVWVSKEKLKQMTSDYIINLPAQDDVGYAFEVDLLYPDHLHKVIKEFFQENIIFFKICSIYYSNTTNFLWLPTLAI